MDEHCSLENGQVFQDYHCLLNLVEGKSDKFYVIQLLTNSQGHFVWTRWGRNGTTGQNKLEGPNNQSEAEKNFKKKFQEKTKNKWENKNSFLPVKGKYTLMKEPSSEKQFTAENVNIFSSFEAEKPDFPDTIVSGVCFHWDLLYQIMFHLSTKDVLRCMQVCRFWKEVLSEKYFWKVFICHRFDLALKTNISNEAPYCMWSNNDDWFCYFDNEDDPFVMRPFPSIWKCCVIHPFGLDPLSGDVRSLQGFSRSLEILTYMKKGVSNIGMASGRQCSGSEGEDGICVVLFPWQEEKLPTTRQLIDQIFHFHPEVIEDCLRGEDDGYIERRSEKLFYHLPKETDSDDEDEEHDDERPCLNRIFGSYFPDKSDKARLKQAVEFYSWLQKIMVPTMTTYVGSDKYNPVTVFFLTKLAPGWVGGALTGVIYT